MGNPEFYDNVKVKVQNIAPCWNGKIGILLRWCHDSWYIVQVDSTELLLSTDKDEFVRVD